MKRYLQKLSPDLAESFIQKNDSGPPDMVDRQLQENLLRQRLGRNPVLMSNHLDGILLFKSLNRIFSFHNFKKIEREGNSFTTTPSSSDTPNGDDNYW